MRAKRLWFIGCGNMGGAMLRRWIETGAIAPGDVDVVNRTDRALPAGVRQARDLPTGPLPDLVILAIKPQQIDDVAGRFADRIAGVPMLVSVLAGVDEPALAARFTATAIVRAMSNLPVGIGKGVVGLQSASADAAARSDIGNLMAPLGLIEWIEPALFDVVTALAGSGPGFLYRFIDALAAGGAALGLPMDQAQRLALATVEGAGLMAAAADDSAAILADRVASPGGSTRSGLDVLDQGDALKTLVARTLAAAMRRNAELAAAAR